MQNINIKEIKSEAKQITKSNFFTIIGTTILFFVLSTLVGIIPIVGFIAFCGFQIGLVGIMLKLFDRQSTSPKEIIVGFKTMFQGFLAQLLATLIIVGAIIVSLVVTLILGLLLGDGVFAQLIVLLVYSCIALGLVFGSGVQFISYVIADKECNALEAISLSFKLMKGHRLNFIKFTLSFIGWFFLSGITFGLAAIWVMPYVQVSTAGYYRRLTEYMYE